ncbi:putative quinol monooxygenase [Spirillospora sp. NPDC048911]|uniref:putative quinol monooxygenase n=1 Tax=Spirillospora sp. NPDC048911 TaxID=3364527 RepID=UPI00371086DE
MVDAALALLATLGALVATGLLISRAYKDRLLYLIAWSLTSVGIAVALASMALGFLLGFNDALFRVMELGGALIAPIWLALGMVELIARIVQVRFAAWLFAVSYTVVATVILMLDPLHGSFSKKLPKPTQIYDALPPLLINGAHLIAVLALVACAIVTALLASKQDREAYELLIPIALVALAGVLVVAGSRGFLPGAVAAVALGGAAGLIWYGGMRTLPVYADDDGGYAGDEYGEEAGSGYADQAYAPPPPPPVDAQHTAVAGAPPVPAGPPVPPPKPATKRGELRFPDPAASEELRFPDPPAPTAIDDMKVAGPSGLDGFGAGSLAASALGAAGAAGVAGAAGAAGLAGAGAALGGALGGLGFGDLSRACGQITVYTLLDGREEAFDRLAEEFVRAARAAEPDTLIFACHEVVNAPTQRIFYQLFRDEPSFASHRQQPHLQRFLTDSRTHVIATNIIELKLGATNLAAPPSPATPDHPRR